MLPLISGILVIVALVISLIQRFSAGFGFASPVATIVYLFSYLSGILFAVLVIAAAKRNAKLVLIPLLISLCFSLIGVISNLVMLSSYGFPINAAYLMQYTILPVVSKILLTLFFFLTAAGVIKTKIPLVIVCVVNLYFGGFVGIIWAWNYEISRIMFSAVSILFSVFAGLPFLLLALAFSNNPNRKYYEKPTPGYSAGGYGGQYYANNPAPPPYGVDAVTGYAPQEYGAAAYGAAAQRFCGSCGKEVPGGNAFCPFCGSRLAGHPSGSGQTPPYYAAPPYGRQGNEQDARSGGFAALGFFFPVIGLILFLVWKETFPLRAKSAGKGALIGVIVSGALTIISVILQVALLM